MPTYSNNLQNGASGQSVRELQEYLKNAGYNIAVDGVFGNQTRSAVEAYQKSQGLVPDGIATPDMLNTLGTSRGTVPEVPVAARTSDTTAAAETETPAPAASSITPPDENSILNNADNISQMLEQYSQPYTQSENVTNLQNAVGAVAEERPDWTGSQYDEQLQTLYDQIMNRPDFEYDINADMLYNQYRDQYLQQGELAMMDTIGQASAMSGGYGNSYAGASGQQAYQSYLQQLNNVVPALEQRAHDRYTQEGQELYNQYGITNQAAQTEYSQHMDSYNQWMSEIQFAQQQFQYAQGTEYGQYQDQQQFWANMQQQVDDAIYQQQQLQMEQAQYDQNLAYDTAMMLVQAGQMPTANLLTSAGIDTADAQALANFYRDQIARSQQAARRTGTSSRRRVPDEQQYQHAMALYYDGGPESVVPYVTMLNQQGYNGDVLTSYTNDFGTQAPPQASQSSLGTAISNVVSTAVNFITGIFGGGR